jgi:hypothetical protein
MDLLERLHPVRALGWLIMIYHRINMLAKLRRVARGKAPNPPIQHLAQWTAERVEAGIARTDVERLHALYCLDDPRPS